MHVKHFVNPSSFRYLFSLFLLFSLLLPDTHASAARLDTQEMTLCLDDEQGRVTSLVDKRCGHDHIASDGEGDLWQIDFPQDAVGRVTPVNATTFSWHEDEATPNTVHLVWEDFGIEALPDLSVQVRIAADTEATTTRWNIQIRSLGTLCPTMVRFPRLPGIAAQELETVAVPYWMGEMTTQARQMLGDGGRREWSYPGILSLQCITLYRDGGPGVYLSANDVRSRSKRFAVFGDGHGGLGLEICHFPGAGDVVDGVYAPPYDVTIGLFEGDWITVAALYRDWALQQSWAAESRLKRGLTPDWVTATGFWVWNRDHSSGVLPPAVAMQDYLGLPVSVFWHWWHGCPYDVGFPEYLPPREGNDAFRAALSHAQEEGIHAIVYMNQRLWGMTTDSWTTKNAEKYAVKKADGTVQPEVYNTFTKSPCASMCMGTSFWRNTYAGLAKEAFSSLGVNGIYMDQACSSLVCYDREHEHAPGGGTYWMEGFHALEADIRTRCPGIALAGEGTGEAWLPHLDMMLSLQVSMERYAAPGQWEPIPFFHAVYHGYTVLYGNYASLTYPPYDSLWPKEFTPEKPLQLLDRKFRHQFRLEQGRAFVWGQQPCLANFREEHLTERAEELDFIRRLALLRSNALPYLLHGTFVRPPDMDIPEMEIAMSRLSIYAGQQDAVQEYTKRVPRLLLCAWRDSSGNIAAPVVNISDEPIKIALRLNTKEHELPKQGIVYKITPEERTEIAQFDHGSVVINETLGGSDSCIYEFRSKIL